MLKELRELLKLLKTAYVSNNRTLDTIFHIDQQMIENYADIIEKILSNDVILVDKEKLKRKFEDVLIEFDENAYCVIFEKKFILHSQIKITNIEYHMNRKNPTFKNYIQNILNMNLFDYFINEVGLKEVIEC